VILFPGDESERPVPPARRRPPSSAGRELGDRAFLQRHPMESAATSPSTCRPSFTRSSVNRGLLNFESAFFADALPFELHPLSLCQPLQSGSRSPRGGFLSPHQELEHLADRVPTRAPAPSGRTPRRPISCAAPASAPHDGALLRPRRTFFIWGDPPPALRWFHYAGYHPRPTDQDRRGPRPGGAQENPERFEKSISFLTQGYQQDPRGGAPERHLPRAVRRDGDVKDIDIFSMCEHSHAAVLREVPRRLHAAQAHRWLSKIARVVRALRRRLQVQERLTQEIATAPHGHAPAARRGGCRGGVSPVHDDGGVEKKRQGGHLGDAGGVPHRNRRDGVLELIKPNLNIVR